MAEVKILNDLANILQQETVKELLKQGHDATNNLINSIDVKVRELVYSYVIEGKSLVYGQWVDSGRRAGAKRVPIDALEQWIRVKNFSLKQGQTHRQLAFAIQQAIFKKGSPTKNKAQKTRFVGKTLEKNEKKITEYITNFSYNYFNTEIRNLVELTNKRI
uniref:Uncharacterized protein n=1 Tax=uncultured marine virus TaxID=186617 RepID=A0A0F7L6L4_9VIRU|nr:hypothetical protein [uncultured marine virus]